VLVDDLVDVNDLNMITWIGSGNIDPKRDSKIYKSSKNCSSKIFIDATKKSLKKDDFKREWPNIVVSDDETIIKVDNKWDKLGLGDFIKSPSLKYSKLNRNKGAIATD
jgi:4-hydroxy-3-polyprenylbenzoate decarboxylase